MVMVGVNVDDILIAGNSRALINEVKGYNKYHFKIKNMGSVKTMISINISHNVLYCVNNVCTKSPTAQLSA
jgi:Reverse transcriptase (RNA-dependent DNA polymerase)